MLEIINGALMIYFLTLCVLSILIPHLVKPITACFNKPSNEERTIWTELVKLKAEQKKISMKDEFAAYSKLQRRINKLESQLKDGSQTRIGKTLYIKNMVQLVLQTTVALVTVLSVVWYRREPIVSLKANLFPFTTMLRYPSEMPNAISTHMWVIVSNVSLQTLFKPLAAPTSMFSL